MSEAARGATSLQVPTEVMEKRLRPSGEPVTGSSARSDKAAWRDVLDVVVGSGRAPVVEMRPVSGPDCGTLPPGDGAVALRAPMGQREPGVVETRWRWSAKP